MSPQEAVALSSEVYDAFVRYANRDIRESNRAANRARKRR